MDNTTPYNAFLDVILGVNNSKDLFKFKFNADTQAYDFINKLEQLDKFLFDIDHNINYVTVEFNGRTTNNN